MKNQILTLVLMLAASVVNAAPDGAALFHKHCAVCHGDGGVGGVGVPLSLASFMSSVSDEYLKTTIRLGRPGRIMPSFPALSDAQLNALVELSLIHISEPTRLC